MSGFTRKLAVPPQQHASDLRLTMRHLVHTLGTRACQKASEFLYLGVECLLLKCWCSGYTPSEDGGYKVYLSIPKAETGCYYHIGRDLLDGDCGVIAGIYQNGICTP
jgi:hypothetical protein